MKAIKTIFRRYQRIIKYTGVYSLSLKNIWISPYYILRRVPKEWNVKYDKNYDSLVLQVFTRAICSEEDTFDIKTGLELAKERNIQRAIKRNLFIIKIIKKGLHNKYSELAFRELKMKKKLKDDLYR